MKPILRLLLIAAVALPMWQSTAAQDVVPPENGEAHAKQVSKFFDKKIATNVMEATIENALLETETGNDNQVVTKTNAPFKVIKGVKSHAKPRVTKVTKSRFVCFTPIYIYNFACF